MVDTFFRKLFRNRHFYIFIFCLTVAISSVAQQRQYSGNFRLPGAEQGTAVFDYYLLGGDTVKNGNFRFQQFIEHFQDSDTIRGFVLNGAFQHNIKNGSWRYVSRNFTISGNPQALDARVVYDVTGQEFLINSNFEEGRAHGVYEILDRALVESQPLDTSFYARFGYRNGAVSGGLAGSTNDLQAEGQFDDEGFPDGDWIITHLSDTLPRTIEIRRYDHGFFSKHFFQIDDDLYEIKHIGFDTLARSGSGLLTRLPVTSTYFRALDYTNIVMDTMAIRQFFDHGDFQQLISRTNHFLERVMVNPAFHGGENVWTKIEGSAPIQPMRIKISKHSFSAEESSLNKSSERYLTEALSLIRNFLNNPNVQIGRFSQEKLAFHVKLLELYESRLTALSPVVHFLADEASEYVDHNAILRHNEVDISYPGQVIYDFGDAPKTGEYTFPPAIDSFTIHQINMHLELVFEDVNKLVGESAPYLEQLMVQSNLNDKEQLLIQQKDSVLNIFADMGSSDAYRGLHRDIRTSVEEQIDRTFKSYSALSSQRRLLEIDSMARCYEQYLEVYDKLTDFDNRLREIDIEYTRSVWNAYTYTYMEERVKERLYRAFEEVILPHHIHRLMSHRSCDHLYQDMDRIDRLLRRMMALRMEDTKNLERQLRRAPKTVEAYLAILGLEQ